MLFIKDARCVRGDLDRVSRAHVRGRYRTVFIMTSDFLSIKTLSNPVRVVHTTLRFEIVLLSATAAAYLRFVYITRCTTRAYTGILHGRERTQRCMYDAVNLKFFCFTKKCNNIICGCTACNVLLFIHVRGAATAIEPRRCLRTRILRRAGRMQMRIARVIDEKRETRRWFSREEICPSKQNVYFADRRRNRQSYRVNG